MLKLKLKPWLTDYFSQFSEALNIIHYYNGFFYLSWLLMYNFTFHLYHKVCTNYPLKQELFMV